MPAGLLSNIYYMNFALILALECSWAFGVHLAHPMTVIPNFFIRLGATPAVIGFLPALWALGTGFGALAVGPAIAHRRRLAVFAGAGHYAGIVPHLGMGLLALSLVRGAMPPAYAQAIALALLMTFNLVMGFLMQVYFVILSRVFPESRRGLWFGTVFSLSSLLSLFGPMLAAVLLRSLPGMPGYSLIFFIGVGVFAVGTVSFFFLRERPTRPWPRRSLAENLAHLYRIWRENTALRKYLLARVWLEVGVMSVAFLATYSRTEAGMSEITVTRMGLIITVCHAFMSLILGWLSGRLEKRGGAHQAYLKTQWLIQAAHLAILGFASVGPAWPAAFLLAFSSGIRITSELVVHPNILLEAGGKRQRVDMITLGAVVLMPVTLIVPPLGGLAIESFGHRIVFGISALLGLPGLVKLARLCTVARPQNDFVID